MFKLYERWTVYDGRDGISGHRSRLVSGHATAAEAWAAQDVLAAELGPSYPEVDAVVRGPGGYDVYPPRPLAPGYQPLTDAEVPF